MTSCKDRKQILGFREKPPYYPTRIVFLRIACDCVLSGKNFNKVQVLEIDENHQGQRLDNYLISLLKGVPKTYIYRIIRKGEVRINKGRVKQTTRLKLGDLVRVPPVKLGTSKNIPIDVKRLQYLHKAVLFEDDALIVLNKPSGLAVHAGSGIRIGVIEAIRALRTDLKYVELVHRLDRETSGCLVLAKKASALKGLQDDFRQNSQKQSRLHKHYLALVKGRWKHGERRIEKALNTEARKQGERTVRVDKHGSYACSIVTPLKMSEQQSLVAVKLLTGRTHQVRVHCMSENHPLAGDQRYGDAAFNKQMTSNGLRRLFLHASRLAFFHPITGQKMEFEAPLPSELNTLVESLF